MADGGDIIIRGGSVDLEYDEAVYPMEPGHPRKHKANGKKIRQITVTDINNDTILYDSGDHPDGLKYKVSVFTK
jgi:hypothetical protein